MIDIEDAGRLAKGKGQGAGISLAPWGIPVFIPERTAASGMRGKGGLRPALTEAHLTARVCDSDR